MSVECKDNKDIKEGMICREVWYKVNKDVQRSRMQHGKGDQKEGKEYLESHLKKNKKV